MKLLAVVGMSGAGKSVITDYLEDNQWKKIYFGGITYKLMNEAGIERTEDGKSEKEFREKLRKEHGPECYAKFLEPEIRDSLKDDNVVLDGLYSWAFDHDAIVYRDLSEIENLFKGGPIAYADYYILNNGTKEEAIERLKKILEEV